VDGRDKHGHDSTGRSFRRSVQIGLTVEAKPDATESALGMFYGARPARMKPPRR